MPVAARDAGPAKRRQAAPPARPTGADKTPAPARRQPPSSARSKPSTRANAPTRGRPAAGAARPTRAAIPVAAGVVWAVAFIGAVVLSSFLTAVLLGVVAVVATASGMRATETRPAGRRRSRSRRPSAALVLALAGALLEPLAALAGPFVALGAVLVLGGVVSVTVLSSGYAASARPLRAVGARLVAAVLPAVAAASVVVARHQGASLAVALVAAVLAYDLGAFVMGNPRTPLGGALGIVFGLVSVGVVAVFVAAVMNPPFQGSRPWVVFGLVALLAPLGVRLGQWVGEERLPALRRVDSWLLAAPVWVLSAALLLHR